MKTRFEKRYAMGPIVLIFSYGGFTTPIDIIKKICNSSKTNNTKLQEASKLVEINEKEVLTYDFNIKNKYFEIDLKLLPYDEPINTLPKEILASTEALIVGFNSADKSFLTHVPKLCKLAEDNSIELALLITGQLFDDSEDGLCYGDIKDICKHTFDVIETVNQVDDDEDKDNDKDKEEQKAAANEDYKEIIEALENHVWSNVASSSSGGDNTKEHDSKKPPIAPGGNDDDDEDLDEQQLEAYEALLTNIVNFKNNSTNLNRDQMLDEAEKLAVLFADFMGDD